MEILKQYWLFTIPAILFLLIITRLGARITFALFTSLDWLITTLLKFPAHLTGAMKFTNCGWSHLLRRLWFLSFFLGLIGLAVVAGIKGWSKIELGVIAFVYLCALAVAKQWIANEKKILEGDSTYATEANHLRRSGVFCFVALVACVPISIHAVISLIPLSKEAPLLFSRSTSILSLNIFYEAFFDLKDILGMEQLDEANSLFVDGAKPLAYKFLNLTHLLVFTYIIIDGIILFSRSEHAIANAMKRLDEIEPVVPFGERVLRRLRKIIKKGIDPNAVNAATVLGRIADADKNATRKATRILLDCLGSERRMPVRQACAEALGDLDKLDTDYTAEVRSKLCKIIFDESQPIGLKRSAARALENIGGVSESQVIEMIELMAATESVPLIKDLADCVASQSFSFAADSRQITILNIIAAETHRSDLVDRIEDCLISIDPEFENNEVATLTRNFRKGKTSTERAAAATELGGYLPENRLALKALLATRNELEPAVLAAVGQALVGVKGMPKTHQNRAISVLRFLLVSDFPADVKRAAAVTLGELDRRRDRCRYVLNLGLKRTNNIGTRQLIISSLVSQNAVFEIIDAFDHQGRFVFEDLSSALHRLFTENINNPELVEEIDEILVDGVVTPEEKERLREIFESSEVELAVQMAEL